MIYIQNVRICQLLIRINHCYFQKKEYTVFKGDTQMFWIIFTVICYTISSLGNKYISSNLSFNEKELWKVEMLFLSIFLIVGIAMILKEKKKTFSTVGVTKGVLTRIPNAAGLIFESMAATENLYFYYDDSAKNIG